MKCPHFSSGPELIFPTYLLGGLRKGYRKWRKLGPGPTTSGAPAGNMERDWSFTNKIYDSCQGKIWNASDGWEFRDLANSLPQMSRAQGFCDKVGVFCDIFMMSVHASVSLYALHCYPLGAKGQLRGQEVSVSPSCWVE